MVSKSKCYAIEDIPTLAELEDKINDFGKTHKIFSTQIYPIISDRTLSWYCMVWFEENKAEPIIENKEELATPGQISALKKMGKFKEGISKREAWQIINQASRKR